MGRSQGTPVFFKKPARLKDLDYSSRQKAILEGEVEFSDIRTTELVALAKKATAKQDDFNLDIINDLLEVKRNPTDYFPQMTPEEAMEILQKLTPWELDYYD